MKVKIEPFSAEDIETFYLTDLNRTSEKFKTKPNEMKLKVDEKNKSEEISILDGLRMFSEHTTAHGFGHVLQMTQQKKKVPAFLFLVSTIVCLAGAIYMIVYDTIETFSSQKFKTSIVAEISEDGLQLPKLVLCHSGIFNITAAEDFGLDLELRTFIAAGLTGPFTITRDFQYNTSWRLSLEKRYDEFLRDYGKDIRHLMYEISWRCESFIHMCSLNNKNHQKLLNGTECCEQFFTPVMSKLGMCYEGHFTNVLSDVGEQTGLMIVFNMPPGKEGNELDWSIIEEQVFPAMDLQATIINDITHPATKVTGEYYPIIRGSKTSLGLEYSVFNYTDLKSGVMPWSESECVSENASASDIMEIKSNCLVYKIVQRLFEVNCTPLFIEMKEPFNGQNKTCTINSMIDFANALERSAEAIGDNDPVLSREYTKSCRDACIEKAYKVNLAVTPLRRNFGSGLPNWNKPHANGSEEESEIGILTVYYSTFEYQKFIQTRVGLSEWLSNVGGTAGFMIGASFITMTETVFFTIFLLKICGMKIWRRIFES